jgi:hypothetical protein
MLINDKTTEPELVSTLLVVQEEQETEEEKENEGKQTTNAITSGSGEEQTVLDEILSDEPLLDMLINDKTTEPELVSTLLVVQEEQNSPLTETCGNQADDDGDGTIDEEECSPTTLPPTETSTEICGNQADDDGDGTIDEEECTLPPAEICGNQADDDGDGTIDEEECTLPPAEICGNQADDDGDGTIDEEECVLPTAEICDNGLDDDTDGKIDSADEDDCPALMPAVAIESAQDVEGDSLSPGDQIAPGEVTFTFSAKPSESEGESESETPLDSQENSQDYEFECALDDGSFNSCNSPETVMIEDLGKHTFVVRLAP